MTHGETGKKPVTLRDVAQAAKVSVSAVSQAINSSGNLHPDTRARILDTARQLGFTPNRYAASLRRRQTMSIGYVSSADDDPISRKRWANYFGQQLAALVSVAGERGYSVTVIPHDKPELIAVTQVDAIYVPEVDQSIPVLEEAQRRNLPVVSNETSLDYPFSITVRSGYDRAAELALDALKAAGAKRIGLLTEVSGYPGDDLGEATYRTWCSNNGFTPVVAHGDYGRTNLKEKLAELIDQGVDGLFSFYEEGPAIFDILQREQVRVPEDFQFIALCLDDCELNARLGVSRVCAHPELAPTSVIDSLVELVEQGKTEHRDADLPVEIGLAATTR